MDTLVKGLAHQGAIRIIVVDSTETVKEAARRHHTLPTATAALGRTLTMGAILGSTLKSDKEKVMIQINGGGALGTILVDANHQCEVRGFVSNPEVHMIHEGTGKLDVGQAVGTNGTLRVIKDLSLKDDFTGTVELQTGEIAEDFAYYFSLSEQTPSAVSLGVLVDEYNQVLSAGGILIQMMPFASDYDVLVAEDVVKHLKPISQMIHEGMTPSDIISALFEDTQVIGMSSVKFQCSCSRERMFDALGTVCQKELDTMIYQDHGAEMTCHFCNTSYRFSEEELRSIKVKH
jgi:molecular chaperone Hsp33